MILALAAFLLSLPGVVAAAALDDPSEVARLISYAIMEEHWGLAAALLVVLLTLGFSKGIVPLIVEKFPKLGFLADKRVTLAVALLGPVAVAIATALIAGAPITVGLIVTAVLTGLGGVGIFSAQKNVREAMVPPAPQPAPEGLAAVVEIKKP